MFFTTKIWEAFGLNRDSLALAWAKWAALCTLLISSGVDLQAHGFPGWLVHAIQATSLIVTISAAQHRTSDLPGGAQKVDVSKTTAAAKVGAILLAAALGAGLVTTAGCASAGNLTSVGQVAAAADKVEQTGLTILHAAQAAHQQTNPLNGQPLISTAQLDQVALVCDQVGRIGTALAQALTDYNAAKASGGDTAKLSASIQSLVGDATAALQAVGKVIPPGTVQSIDQAVTSALGLYAEIKAAAL